MACSKKTSCSGVVCGISKPPGDASRPASNSPVIAPNQGIQRMPIPYANAPSILGISNTTRFSTPINLPFSSCTRSGYKQVMEILRADATLDITVPFQSTPFVTATYMFLSAAFLGGGVNPIAADTANYLLMFEEDRSFMEGTNAANVTLTEHLPVEHTQSWEPGCGPLVATPTLYNTIYSFNGVGYTGVAAAGTGNLWYRVLEVTDSDFEQILAQNLKLVNVPAFVTINAVA